MNRRQNVVPQNAVNTARIVVSLLAMISALTIVSGGAAAWVTTAGVLLLAVGNLSGSYSGRHRARTSGEGS